MTSNIPPLGQGFLQNLNAGSLCKIIQACCFSTGNVALDTDLVKSRATLRPTLRQSSDSVSEMPPAHSNMPAPHAGNRLFHGIPLDAETLPEHFFPPCYPHSQPLSCFQLSFPSQDPRGSRGSPAAPHSATTHLRDLTPNFK